MPTLPSQERISGMKSCIDVFAGSHDTFSLENWASSYVILRLLCRLSTNAIAQTKSLVISHLVQIEKQRID